MELQKEKGWWIDSEGLLRFRNAIAVPPDSAILAEILKVYHDDPFAGHLGHDKTQEPIERKYYWESLRTDVAHVKSCPECQYNKTLRRRPYGKLSSLTVPEGSGQSLSMDFISAVPPCARDGVVCDAILVFMDRYTKTAEYIPTTKKAKASDLERMFFKHVLTKTGAPRSLISDRDLSWRSNFQIWPFHAKTDSCRAIEEARCPMNFPNTNFTSETKYSPVSRIRV